ncbi:MAG: ATP-binding cassette domain-containing protein [Alphaproteobacteria bacterium]|nr:ATP-binding cassette domain-containing protein [Alphaproteobacteria bacterium]
MSIAAATAQTSADWLTGLANNNVLRWQHGGTNIGLLLAPLLSVNGWQGDIFTLTDALPANTQAVKTGDLLAVMGALGYRIRQERRLASDIRSEDTPGLFVPDNCEGWCTGMVLRELGTYGLIWEDGREQHRGNLPEGKGTLYRFERQMAADAAVEGVFDRKQIDWLADFAGRFRPIVLHVGALSFIMHFFTLAMPLFSMAVYDRVIGAQAIDTLPLLALGVLAAIGIEMILRLLRTRLAGWIGARCGVLVPAAMFERLLYLPSAMIEQASVAAQLARIRAFEAVRDFITGPIFLAVLEVPFVLLLILVIALLAGPVALVSVGALVFYLGLFAVLRPYWRKLGHDSARGAAQGQQLLMEAITNLKALHASGISGRMLQRYKAANWHATQAQYRFSMIASVVQHLAGLMTVIVGVASIAWCLTRVWDGDMSAGAMVATMILTWRVIFLMQTMCSVLPHLEQISAAAEQVGHLMKMTPEAHARNTVLAHRPLEGAITFQNVGLRYGRKKDPVFVGLSAEIAKGQIVAIYGGNGSGKSTMLRLMLGLYPAVMGSILLDGIDHRQFDPRNLRRQIAYLPQVPELLPGTVAENLRLVDPLMPDFRLRQALLWADAWEMVDELPAGVNTRIGTGGLVPSSGLAARLCLARLYLSERPIVLCDELPSQLMNSSTGARFRRYLNESRGKQTVLFVTHRQDMLQVADQVIWMKNGGRPAVGKPEQMEKQTQEGVTTP